MTLAEGNCCFVVPLVWWILMFSSWRRRFDHSQMIQLWPAYEQADKHPRAYTRYAFSHVELLKGMDLNPNWTCRNQGFLNRNKYCKFGHLQLYSLNLFPFPISLSKVFFFNTWCNAHLVKTHSRCRPFWTITSSKRKQWRARPMPPNSRWGKFRR